MLLYTGLTSHTVGVRHLGDALLLSQDHRPNTARGSREGSSPGSPHVAHCVQSEITARSNSLQMHILKKHKAENPQTFPLNHTGSGRVRQRERDRQKEKEKQRGRVGAQQHQLLKSAWFLIAHTSSHSRTQCFLFLAHKNWCSSRASFHPFFSVGLFAFIPSALPPFSLSPLSLQLGRSSFVSVLPSFLSEDVRHGSVWVCLPSPFSLSLLHSSSLLSHLFSPFTRRRRDIASFSLFSSCFFLLVHCKSLQLK